MVKLASVQRLALAAAKPLHLHVQLSNRFSYARVLQASDGALLAEASTAEAELAQGLETKSGIEGCGVVGRALAGRLRERVEGGVSWAEHIHVVRPPGKRFHGKFKELVLSFKGAIEDPGK